MLTVLSSVFSALVAFWNFQQHGIHTLIICIFSFWFAMSNCGRITVSITFSVSSAFSASSQRPAERPSMNVLHCSFPTKSHKAPFLPLWLKHIFRLDCKHIFQYKLRELFSGKHRGSDCLSGKPLVQSCFTVFIFQLLGIGRHKRKSSVV